MATNDIDPRPLIEAAYMLAGAPEGEQQMLDFALTSLRVRLMEGFTQHPESMPSAALVVERVLDLINTAQADVADDS